MKAEKRDVEQLMQELEYLSLKHVGIEDLLAEAAPPTADAVNRNQRHGTLLNSLIDLLKRTEQEKRKNYEFFRAVLDCTQDCLFIKDADLRYTHVNNAMRRLLGIDADQILGKTEEEVFHLESGSHIKQVDLRVLAGESVEEEFTREIGGSSVTLHDTRVPLFDADGRIAGLCGIARDLTQRKRSVCSVRTTSEGYKSGAMQAALKQARLAASTDSTVLLQGESGSGKDYFARYIHDHSGRAGKELYTVNCAAIPLELAESELFGHEAGAFTGATRRRKGMFEIAEGGSLLLNEIGELSLPIQSKLLAFLDSRSFARVGGEATISVNVRLMAATNKDLQQEVAEGRFREDLFYRLNVFGVKVPALRERIEDMPALVRDLLAKIAAETTSMSVPFIAPETIEILKRYSWPGNVRELRNLLERTFVLFSHGEDMETDFLLNDDETCRSMAASASFPTDRSLEDILNDIERSYIEEALRRTGGKREAAANLLGISRHSLKRRLQKFGDPLKFA